MAFSLQWVDAEMSLKATRKAPGGRMWRADGLDLKVRRWDESEHDRDRRGRFAEMPAGGAAFSAPSAATDVPADRLGRVLAPGDTVLRYGRTATVVKIMPKNRVQVTLHGGKKATYESREFHLVARGDGSSVGGDGLPYHVPALSLKPGDRVAESSKVGYRVTGTPELTRWDTSLYAIPVVNVATGKPEEMFVREDEYQLYYPPGMPLPQEGKAREERSSRITTLKPGERFRFGMPGIDQPVYTTLKVGEPYQVEHSWRGRNREIITRKTSLVDLELRTADGDVVSLSMEDSPSSGVKRETRPLDGAPFVPASVVKVGDVLADPENRGDGDLTVTAITREPHMSQDQRGWTYSTHATLLTLRDEKGNVRKIYNRSDFQGVRRVRQIEPPVPEPKDAPPEPAPPLPDEPTVRPAIYSDDRSRILAMGLEKDPGQPEAVRQAVAALNARGELTARQASGLAAVLRARNGDPATPKKEQRANTRAAGWLDAAAAEIAGREAPAIPGRDKVEKIAASELTRGDTVALVNPDASVTIATVSGDLKSNTWGITWIPVTHADGREEVREVLSKAAVYLLPDLPPQIEVAPPGPPREHVHADRLRPGDVVQFDAFEYEVKKSVQTGPISWDVTLMPKWLEQGKRPKAHVRHTDIPAGNPTFVRITRGKGSQNQPWDQAMPPEEPTSVSVAEILRGDRITLGGGTGTALKVTPTAGGEHIVDMLDDYGQERQFTAYPDTSVQRLIAVDDNAEARIARQASEAHVNRLRGQVASWMADYHQTVLDEALRALDSASTTPQAVRSLKRIVAKRENLPPSNLGYRISNALLQEGDNDARKAFAGRVEALETDIEARVIGGIIESLKAAEALPGESDKTVLARIKETLGKAGPPQPGVYRDAADSVAALHPKLRKAMEGGPSAGLPEFPQFADDVDLKRRTAAYRKALGESGFGERLVTRPVVQVPSLTDLEAGVVPDVTMVTEGIVDTSPDGGPGRTAMRHLEILRVAGRDLKQEMDRRIETELGARAKKADRISAAQAAAAARRKAAISILAEVRAEPMGGKLNYRIAGPEMDDAAEHQVQKPTKQDEVDLKQAMKFATDAYPSSWLGQMRAKGAYRLKKAGRGYHIGGRHRVIALSPATNAPSESGPYGEAAVHEIGHGMEEAVPGLRAAEAAFMWSRVAQGEIGSRTRPPKRRIYAHVKNEEGWKDDFPNRYSGKDYSGQAYELFTTGIQELTGGGQGFLDEDFTHWLLGALALL